MIGSQIELFKTFFIKFSTSKQNKEKTYNRSKYDLMTVLVSRGHIH